MERKQKHKIEEVMKNLFTNCYLLKVFKTLQGENLQIEIGNGQCPFSKEKHSVSNNGKTFPESPKLLSKYKILFELKLIHDSY